MGIYEKYAGLRSAWAVRAIETLVIGGTRPVWGRVIGAVLTEDEITLRRYRMPVHKAEIGAVAVQQGLEAEDAQLQQLGAAMVVKAAADAAHNPDDLVVLSEVQDVAATVPIGDIAANPFVAPEIAGEAAPVIGTAKPIISSRP